VIIYYQLG